MIWIQRACLLIVLPAMAGCCCPGDPGRACRRAPPPVAAPSTPVDWLARIDAATQDPYRRDALSDAGILTLKQPTRVALLSLDPEIWGDAGDPEGDAWPLDHALGWATAGTGVLGTLPLQPGAGREAGARVFGLLTQLQAVAECYDPRHALVFRRAGHSVVLVLCFECEHIVLLEPGMSDRRMRYFADPHHRTRDWINRQLDRAGIKRDRPPEPDPDEEDDMNWDLDKHEDGDDTP